MKPKLLVVDDDHSVRESLTKLLESEHYEVYPARDAAEAMEYFNSTAMDLVVLDINLGADNGWNVFERMTIKNPFVPTIVITAEWGQREQAVTLGVEGLIEKPINVPAFLNMIRELLAETTEAKLKRICGNEAYSRYIGRHYEPYLRMLQKRCDAPLRMAFPHEVLPAEAPEVESARLELIPMFAAEPDGPPARIKNPARSRKQTRTTYEDDAIKRTN